MLQMEKKRKDELSLASYVRLKDISEYHYNPLL